MFSNNTTGEFDVIFNDLNETQRENLNAHLAEEELAKKDYITLPDDMYCYTICANFAQDKFSENQLEGFMRRSLMVFMLQICLATLFYT